MKTEIRPDATLLMLIFLILVLNPGIVLSSNIEVKLGEFTQLSDVEFTVPVQAIGIDSLGAGLVILKLAVDRNQIQVSQVRLSEPLNGQWFLFDTIKSGTSEVDTLWIGLSSQHALFDDGDLVNVNFQMATPSEEISGLSIISAKLKVRSLPPIDAVVNSEGFLTSSTEGQTVPKEFALEQNYPNPFNAETKIKFHLPIKSHVNISIYNLLGQRILKLLDQEFVAGIHEVMWEGKLQNEQPASSGIYIYSIRAGDFARHQKMILVK